jgi:hypothetical protein
MLNESMPDSRGDVLSTGDYATLVAWPQLHWRRRIFGTVCLGAVHGAACDPPGAAALALAMFTLLDCTSAWRIGLADPKRRGGRGSASCQASLVGTVIGMTLLRPGASRPRHWACSCC